MLEKSNSTPQTGMYRSLICFPPEQRFAKSASEIEILSQVYMYVLPCNVNGGRSLTYATNRQGLGHLYRSKETEPTSLLPQQHSEEGT